jgi:hypothetical protein
MWRLHVCPKRRGTGFSRESGISTDEYSASVPASSRLKPVHAISDPVGAELARDKR